MTLLLLLSGLLTGCTENVIGKIGDDPEDSLVDDDVTTDLDGTPDDGSDETGEDDHDGTPSDDDGGHDTGTTDDGTPSDEDADGAPPDDDGDGDDGDDGDDGGDPTPIPSLLSLILSPDPVYTHDTLSATAEASEDAEVLWSWSLDGFAISASSDHLDGDTWFEKHDEISVTATPILDGAAGSPMSASIVVSNSLPSAPDVDISPSSPIEGEDALHCTISDPSNDDDLDAITYSASWTVDGVPHISLSDTFDGDTIPYTLTTAGDIWVCTVTPNDGEADGPSASASITIEAVPFVEPTLDEVCTSNLLSVGTPTIIDSGYREVGSWGPDHHISGLDGYWVFEDYDDDQFRGYSGIDGSGLIGPTTSYELEDDWSGTGQLIFNGSLYYQEEGGALVRFDLETGSELARITLPGVGVDADFDYSYGGRTSIDFDTDGEDLYVIHSSSSVAGRFQATQLNPITLSPMGTSTAPTGLKTEHSNAFIACGVLYAMGSEFWIDTTINYAWEIGSSMEWDPDLAWEGMSFYRSAHYSSVDNLIYTHNGSLMTLTPTWGP